MGEADSLGGRTELLSSNQLRMWLYCQALPKTPTFHGPVAVRLDGPLHAAGLSAAVDRLAARHEILRTRFPIVGHAPVQLIEGSARVRVSWVDLTHLPPSTRDGTVLGLMDRIADHGFDYASAPAWSVVIVRLTPVQHVLALTAHHMIVDLWSIGLMIDELCDLYRTASTGLPSDLPPAPLQQAALAAQQRDRLSRARTIARQQWWRQHLNGIPAARLVPDRPSPSVPRLTSDVYQTQLDPGLSEDIRALSKDLGATVYATTFSALAVLLARWCDQTEFSVVSNTSGRLGRDAEQVVGTPVEYLIVRLDTAGDPTYRDLVTRIGEAALEAFDHMLPLDDMVQAIDPGRQLWPSPLRQLGFAVLNTPRATPSLPDVDLSPLTSIAPFTEVGISEGELWVEIFEAGSGPLGIRWQFGTGLFEPSSAQAAVQALTDVLAEAMTGPDRRLSEFAVSYRPQPVAAAVAPSSTPDDIVVESVKAAVAHVLGVDPVAERDNFFLLGGGTADAVAMAGILSTQWNVELGALEVELAPTIRGIAVAVARRMS
ncbi:hypothetical protein Rhe02_15280 [Rhizocola hellebori]|uniref:Carrier domain-containing protein n=1 Tax=Rhizocola hellebori TaxID=1392758 RepID=A0A8J3VEM5_9ACTN|nr:condensation domain-containing protein [Rhizocola hellebori]GIH03461.1 hypothetical protein Rhe02_15280 [Rhizocola hellebori]